MLEYNLKPKWSVCLRLIYQTMFKIGSLLPPMAGPTFSWASITCTTVSHSVMKYYLSEYVCFHYERCLGLYIW